MAKEKNMTAAEYIAALAQTVSTLEQLEIRSMAKVSTIDELSPGQAKEAGCIYARLAVLTASSLHDLGYVSEETLSGLKHNLVSNGFRTVRW